jgi:hypothetical protein
VEAAVRGDAILLRRSVDPDDPVLTFTHAAWRDLTARIKQISEARVTPNGVIHMFLATG